MVDPNRPQTRLEKIRAAKRRIVRNMADVLVEAHDRGEDLLPSDFEKLRRLLDAFQAAELVEEIEQDGTKAE